MEEHSLSLMKYAQLGKKVKSTALGRIIHAPDPLYELPPLFDSSNNLFKLDAKHESSEDVVQTMLNQAFVGLRIGTGFYVRDTHKIKTFLGADLMPDLMVSSIECDEILGEYQVAFMIEVKAGKVNPCSIECLGQAASYGTRRLIYFDKALLLSSLTCTRPVLFRLLETPAVLSTSLRKRAHLKPFASCSVLTALI